MTVISLDTFQHCGRSGMGNFGIPCGITGGDPMAVWATSAFAWPVVQIYIRSSGAGRQPVSISSRATTDLLLRIWFLTTKNITTVIVSRTATVRTTIDPGIAALKARHLMTE